MSEQKELLEAAALLERAYRLAHVLQGEGLLEIGSRQFVADENTGEKKEAQRSTRARRTWEESC